ncbi:MAG: type IV pilus assembly protein PilM [Deltaproteobacteria bacterium]|nr:type IV pilus assembly protein PilM [Deltaproteobacteria bacterium]
MARKPLLLGLDIGSSSIKLVQLKETKKGRAQLINFGVAPLPPEAIVDGALMNSTAIVEAIQSLTSSLKIKKKHVTISVSGHSVIIKKINIPLMTEEELEESIQWEAEQYIPFDINDVNIDVQILNPNPNDAGQMEVLLVAAKKDIINDYTAVTQEAGLQPMVVDVDAFAVMNAFEANYSMPEDETIVLLNIGASVININVVANGIATFTRDISMGGNQYTEEIQKQLNVSYDEAEALKLGGDLGADSDSVVPQEVESVIQNVSQTLAAEIQRSLDFYAATSVDAQFGKIFVSGGTGKIPALVKTIESKVAVPVEVMDPFRNIEINEKHFDPAYLRDIAPMAAVSVGLGLRRVGDK